MSEDWAERLTKRIGEEIKRLRGDRSGQWLSDRTAELGHRVSRSTISEIETHRRKSITAADLVILAAALDTAPVALVYPPPYNEDVEALPGKLISKFDAAQEFSGIFDAKRDKVSGDYWMNTLRLRSEREVRDDRLKADRMFEIGIAIGDEELAKRAAQKLAQLDVDSRSGG